MPNPKLVPNVTFSQNCLFVENFKCKVTCFFLYKVHEFLHLMTSSLPLQRDQSASYERNCESHVSDPAMHGVVCEAVLSVHDCKAWFRVFETWKAIV